MGTYDHADVLRESHVLSHRPGRHANGWIVVVLHVGVHVGVVSCMMLRRRLLRERESKWDARLGNVHLALGLQPFEQSLGEELSRHELTRSAREENVESVFW